MPKFLTSRDVADRYHVSIETVRAWHREGKGPRGVKNGRQLLFPEAEVHRYDIARGLIPAIERNSDWDAAVQLLTAAAAPFPPAIRDRVVTLLKGSSEESVA